MSQYGCNDLIPRDRMTFMNDGLTTDPLAYKVHPYQPEYTLTFGITIRLCWSAIILKGTDKELHRAPSIWLHPGTTKLYCRISTADIWNDGIEGSQKDLILNRQHHVALILSDNTDGRRLMLYIDGEHDSTHIVNSKVWYREDMPFTLGGNEPFPCFNGVLYRPRFYNYAMTDEATIRQDMHSSTPLIRDGPTLS